MAHESGVSQGVRAEVDSVKPGDKNNVVVEREAIHRNDPQSLSEDTTTQRRSVREGTGRKTKHEATKFWIPIYGHLVSVHGGSVHGDSAGCH